MTTRYNHKNKLLAVKSAELAMAVPQVVAHRVARMAFSGFSHTADDRKEIERMGEEKTSAFMDSWSAMTVQAWRSYHQIGLSAFQSFWNPIAGLKPPTQSPSNQMNNAVSTIFAKGLAPVHRRVVANAKRLNYIRLR